MPNKNVKVDLGDGAVMLVTAEQHGVQMVADKDFLGRLDTVTRSIERVSRDVLDAIKKARPSKATVELGFGLAIEEGQLVALFGKGKGEANISVVLEWTSDKDDG